MLLFWLVLALAVAFVIAAVVLGREASRLHEEPPRPVFVLEEAVQWVAGHLPFEVSAVLSHDDVRRILQWNLAYFRSRGVSSNGESAEQATSNVIVGGAETVDYVLVQARAAELDYTAVQVHAVLDAQMAYLEAIGALGQADEPPPEA